MRAIWTLRYDRKVTAFLRSIRDTDTYDVVHDTIKALQYKVDPTEGCREVIEEPGMYEFEAAGYWIGIRVVIDNKAVRVLYITIG